MTGKHDTLDREIMGVISCRSDSGKPTRIMHLMVEIFADRTISADEEPRICALLCRRLQSLKVRG